MQLRLPLSHRKISPRPFLLAPLLAAAAWSALAADAPAVRSANVTVNLINRMVERNLLSAADAAELIRQAEADAAAAQQQAAVAQSEAIKLAVAQALAAQQAGAPASAPVAATPAPAPEGTVRVTYVPEMVRTQIRDQIKAEVMAQAREERWADPRSVPDWVARLRLTGDVRVRHEGLYFPSGNDNTGAFPNFNAINTGNPFDTTGTVFSPQLNVDQDRTRERLRFRLAGEVQLDDGFTSGFRLATGDSSSPVSANQSFGTTGGQFSKYAIWLDRAFLKYQSSDATTGYTALFGRFENPFFSTELMWDDDLGFDGFAGQARRDFSGAVTVFATAGAFPVFNTDLNFASIQPAKFKSTDKWLYAAQIGADWKATKDTSLKVGLAYYDFMGIEGKLSSPFTPLTAADQGDTDGTRPSFAQKGNTYMALRNITPSALNGFGTTNQFQYFGLATPFQDLALTMRLDFNRYAPVQVSLTGDFIKNLALDRAAIATKAVNNLGSGGPGNFVGGDTAWTLGVKIGHAALAKRGDWSVSLGYRHVESDAVVDGFTDSDFGGGGTNVQGFTLGGTYALSPRVWAGIRWMSSDSIAGPTFKNDTFQVDLNAKF